MATQILINIGLGNGLLSDGTEALPEPMFQWHSHDSNFTASVQATIKITIKIGATSPRGQWVKNETYYNY